MTEHDAVLALSQADQLAAQGRHAGRWYAVYLVIYAVATFVICLGFGLIHGKTAALVLTPIWVALVIILSVWAARQRYVVAGMSRIHLLVIGSWSVAWLITVFVGTMALPTSFGWWVFGGVLTAIPPVIGAVVVARRTR